MALHCLLARFCCTYVLCVTLVRGFTDRLGCCGGSPTGGMGGSPSSGGRRSSGVPRAGRDVAPGSHLHALGGASVEAAPPREREAVNGMLELDAPHRASPAWEAAAPRQRVAAKGLLRLQDVTPPSRALEALERKCLLEEFGDT